MKHTKGIKQMKLPMSFEEMKAKALDKGVCPRWKEILNNAQSAEDIPEDKISEAAYCGHNI